LDSIFISLSLLVNNWIRLLFLHGKHITAERSRTLFS
jgi:hypothetical protein